MCIVTSEDKRSHIIAPKHIFSGKRLAVKLSNDAAEYVLRVHKKIIHN